MAPTFLSIFLLFSLSVLAVHAARLPRKIYGVNIGSWLLIEPWMLPAEWLAMGGQQCDDCSTCIASEFAFAKAFPNTVDATFNKHWTSWFTSSDIATLKAAGINTVRIPLGYWIVEDLVDRSTEFYPRGGLAQLRRGLTQLNAAGIVAILDHHALPGVQASNQMFAGRCTSNVQFYTAHNYHRALIWTAVMTALSHIDKTFINVAAIQAVNEPLMDANLTPGYGDFQKNFVQVVRAIELALGMPVPGTTTTLKHASTNITEAIMQAAAEFSPEVGLVLTDAMPIILKLAMQIGLSGSLNTFPNLDRDPITTDFMDINWQFNNPSNPHDAALGPQSYDNHLYYSFGGVADPNEQAYLTHLCNLDRIQNDAALGNSPLHFGEWSLATNFPASDDFLRKWADAQKLQYGKDAGWIFWNFKIEVSSQAGDTARQWSYLEGLKRGYFTQDPTQFHDPHVCDSFIN